MKTAKADRDCDPDSDPDPEFQLGTGNWEGGTLNREPQKPIAIANSPFNRDRLLRRFSISMPKLHRKVFCNLQTLC